MALLVRKIEHRPASSGLCVSGRVQRGGKAWMGEPVVGRSPFPFVYGRKSATELKCWTVRFPADLRIYQQAQEKQIPFLSRLITSPC